ncbi:MAG: hypothetical protein OXC19_00025 [Bryobacterales bacterium]|nr:hypothetical protein [Bryobacterales bacterium]
MHEAVKNAHKILNNVDLRSKTYLGAMKELRDSKALLESGVPGEAGMLYEMLSVRYATTALLQVVRANCAVRVK